MLSCWLSFSVCFVLAYSGLFAFILILFYYFRCLFSDEREQERVWIWVGRSKGRIWEEMGAGESESDSIVWKKSIFNFFFKKSKNIKRKKPGGRN